MTKHEIVTVKLSDLKPHPKNYRQHPDDQIAHLEESLRRFGVYRNIVVARDNTILAGHGVAKAAKKLGLEEVPVVRLDVDPDEPGAIKVLVGDNEVQHLMEQDDRLLSELLKRIKDEDPSKLLGTGYDEMMLANFLMVTRPQSEIADLDEAAEWVGMPEFSDIPDVLKIVVIFRNEDDRAEFARRLDLRLSPKTRSTWFPPKPREDVSSLKFKSAS